MALEELYKKRVTKSQHGTKKIKLILKMATLYQEGVYLQSDWAKNFGNLLRILLKQFQLLRLVIWPSWGLRSKNISTLTEEWIKQGFLTTIPFEGCSLTPDFGFFGGSVLVLSLQWWNIKCVKSRCFQQYSCATKAGMACRRVVRGECYNHECHFCLAFLSGIICFFHMFGSLWNQT